MDIIHIGSTSIEGMSAKPIIDIDIVIECHTDFEDIATRLEKIGYYSVGNLGITSREVLNLDRPSIYPHHLYVCQRNSVAFKNHLLLQQHLSENARSFKKYNDLKLRLAQSVISHDEYWKSKTSLIFEFLKAEGMSTESLNKIRNQNQ